MRLFAAYSCLLLAVAGLPVAAVAQPSGLPPPPEATARPLVIELAPAAQRLLSAGYLSDDERIAARLQHGQWTEADLADPARRARAALVSGAVLSQALDAGATLPIDRAAALLLRGEPNAALEALTGQTGVAADRLRAEALEQLGRFPEAVRAVDELVARVRGVRLEADDTAELVRALAQRRRLAGPAADGARDDTALLALLKTARETSGALSWRVRLVEALLLLERHQLDQAAEAAQEALALNPRSAEALALLGGIMVAGFDFANAALVANELDRLAAAHDAPSIDAAMLRARMALRQDTLWDAAAAFVPVEARAPEHRGLLALRAAVAYAGFNDAAGAEIAARFNELAPGHPLAAYEIGRALSEQRQYDDARTHLARAAELLPTWSQPWIDLGLLEVQAGRDDAARAALDKALALDAFNQRAVNSYELVRGVDGWPVLESTHFRVRYREGPDALLAAEMLPVLEQIHARVTASPLDVPGGFDHEPAGKTLIELMPTHRWFSVRITGATQVHTLAAATGPVIAMESPREGPDLRHGPYDWPRVVQHEYAHTVTLSRTRNRIPHWFTEAAAVNVEDAPRDHQTWELLHRAFATGGLFDLDQINIAFVRPEKPTDRSQAYAQGHWMFQFVVDRWGPEAPLRLMDRYAAGEPETEAFEAELGIGREAFMSAFSEWAEAQLRAFGLMPASGTPSLELLLDQARMEAPADADAEGDNAASDKVNDLEARLSAWLVEHPGHPELLGAAVRVAVDGLGPADERPARLAPALVDLLLRAAAARPTDDEPHRLLARHYLAGDDKAERQRAMPHLAFLDVREQTAPLYAIELARLHADAGDPARALASALRAVRISPFDADYREFAARAALVLKDYPEAERHIEALVALEPDRPVHAKRLEAVRALRTQP